MDFDTPEVLVINPSLGKNSPVLSSLFKTTTFLLQFTSVKISVNGAKELTEVALTHPLFQFEKPERTSTRTRELKAKATYFAVFNPKPLGDGGFGAVYTVLGVWKQTTEGWIYKTKSDPAKVRLMKANIPPISKLMAKNALLIEESYHNEQKIGRWVPHMSYKHAVVTHHFVSFLLMRRQEGVSLKSILDRAKNEIDFLSVMDRFNLTVNLLKALDAQITGVKIGDAPDQKEYIIHRDIKPDNIIIGKDLAVKFIDYGLAIPSDTRAKIAGTPLYMDPYLLSGDQDITPSKVTDLASLARVIAELWGDTSRDFVDSQTELHAYNQQNTLDGLLDFVFGLDQEERQKLSLLIQSMTQFENDHRLTREEALRQFEALRDAHLAEQRKWLLGMATYYDFNLFSEHNLFDLLTSVHAPILIARFKADKSQFPLVFKLLKSRLLDLNESTLFALRDNGLQFAQVQISIQSLTSMKVSVLHLDLLIRLGVKVAPSLLQNWLDFDFKPESEIYWVQICRLLYNNTANADQLLKQHTFNDPFKIIFCQHYLPSKETAVDDLSTARLLKRHRELVEAREKLILAIKNLLQNQFANTPLQKAILASTLMNPCITSLILMPSTTLSHLQSQLLAFVSLGEAIKLLKPLEPMQQRKQVIKTLFDELQKRMQPIDGNWQAALGDLGRLQTRLDGIQKTDAVYEQILLANGDKAKINVLLTDLDTYYLLEKPDFQLLDCANLLVKASKSIKAIQFIKQQLHSAKMDIAADVPVEMEFARLVLPVRISELKLYSDSLIKFHQFYARVKEVFTTLHDVSVGTRGLAKSRGLLFNQLQTELHSALKQASTEEAITLINQYAHFIAGERELVRRTIDFRPCIHMIYDLLLKKTEAPRITFLAELLSRVNARHLIDKCLLNKIEKCLDFAFWLKDHSGYDDKINQLKNDLWVLFTDKSPSRRAIYGATHDKLDVLIEALNEIKGKSSQYINSVGLFAQSRPGQAVEVKATGAALNP